MMNVFDKNLERLANLVQLKSYEILVKDFNNTDLMKYLAHQDELLDTIIKQNEQIIHLLKGGDNGYRRNNTKNS
jgi:hypothetical protein